MARIFLLCAAVAVWIPAGAWAGRCVGADPCNVCSNCKRCAHCRHYGTCGACKRSEDTAPASQPAGGVLPGLTFERAEATFRPRGYWSRGGSEKPASLELGRQAGKQRFSITLQGRDAKTIDLARAHVGAPENVDGIALPEFETLVMIAIRDAEAQATVLRWLRSDYGSKRRVVTTVRGIRFVLERPNTTSRTLTMSGE